MLAWIGFFVVFCLAIYICYIGVGIFALSAAFNGKPDWCCVVPFGIGAALLVAAFYFAPFKVILL